MLKGSLDSLGTRSLLERDRPESSNDGRQLCEKVSFYSQSLKAEKFPVSFSDVSFFGDSDTETDNANDQQHGYQNTLAILKPETAGLMYKIESIIDRNGFIIKTHTLEMFYPRLIDHMSSGPIVVYVLSKKNAIEEWRRLIGPANVSFAKRDYPISLRAIYGKELGSAPVANAFHGSDSRTAAKREIHFFFPNSVEGEIEPTEEDVAYYIQNIMMPTINEGLFHMCKLCPDDPLRWFGNWLLTQNIESL